ncbi:unnamed protein product [Chrysoparadoxa australica]
MPMFRLFLASLLVVACSAQKADWCKAFCEAERDEEYATVPGGCPAPLTMEMPMMVAMTCGEVEGKFSWCTADCDEAVGDATEACEETCYQTDLANAAPTAAWRECYWECQPLDVAVPTPPPHDTCGEGCFCTCPEPPATPAPTDAPVVDPTDAPAATAAPTAPAATTPPTAPASVKDTYCAGYCEIDRDTKLGNAGCVMPTPVGVENPLECAMIEGQYAWCVGDCALVGTDDVEACEESCYQGFQT